MTLSPDKFYKARITLREDFSEDLLKIRVNPGQVQPVPLVVLPHLVTPYAIGALPYLWKRSLRASAMRSCCVVSRSSVICLNCLMHSGE